MARTSITFENSQGTWFTMWNRGTDIFEDNQVCSYDFSNDTVLDTLLQRHAAKARIEHDGRLRRVYSPRRECWNGVITCWSSQQVTLAGSCVDQKNWKAASNWSNLCQGLQKFSADVQPPTPSLRCSHANRSLEEPMRTITARVNVHWIINFLVVWDDCL